MPTARDADPPPPDTLCHLTEDSGDAKVVQLAQSDDSESARGHGAAPAPTQGGAHTYVGPVNWEYAPEIDGDPDPGEIVWTWVAFEDNPSIGKDRPVAIVGRTTDHRLAALMLSSRDRGGDPRWLAIGSGAWDPERRPSWLRRDRVLAVPPSAVRREGAVLPRATFDAVISAVGSRPTASPDPTMREGLAAGFKRLLGRPLPRG